MLKWLPANAAWILSILAAGWIVYALVRAITAAWRHRHRPGVIEEFERTEKIRQQIRRKIADRKANPSTPTPSGLAEPKPAKLDRGLRPIDPFGGPTRRWWTRVRNWLRGDRAGLVNARS